MGYEKDTLNLLGMTEGDERAEDALEAVNGLLDFAFDIAYAVYSPFGGVRFDSAPASVTVAPSAAVVQVLRDLADAAPTVPEWFEDAAMSDPIAAMAVDEVIMAALNIAHDFGGQTEEQGGIAYGVNLLRNLADLGASYQS